MPGSQNNNPKTNYLLSKIAKLFREEARGNVLDLGCGKGEYARVIKDLGFSVVAADLNGEAFGYRNEIEFKQCDVVESLPFADNYFDYVLFLEVIEHLRNPYAVIKEINRVLKIGGKLFISTPNIMNLRSRFRFLFEGSFEFFREPLLEQVNSYQGDTKNLHLIPWRYQELEYALAENGFSVDKIFADMLNPKIKMGSFLVPLLRFQANLKRKRSQKKGSIDYARINKILLSDELLYGRHLIIRAVKN